MQSRTSSTGERVCWGWITECGYDPYYYGPDYAYDDSYYDGGYPVDQGYVASPGYVVSGGADPAYCAQRYRSYDPASGTYLGYDGLRHPCGE